MIGGNLRVAFFPDAYHEVDGVANTSRHFEAFAVRNHLPFLTICGGSKDSVETEGTITRLERRRGRIGFALDKKHDFDLAFWRHYGAVESAVRDFAPDVVHITGPSDVGQLGALIAHRLRLPLAASWHTNLHQYAQQRALRMLPFLPAGIKRRAGSAIRGATLRATLRFYQIARVLFAPNQELMEVLERGTGKPCYPMQRGVDSNLFHPRRRNRKGDELVLGYVGRLSTEKNVRFLAELERELLQGGLSNFRFLIVGQGADEPWLKANLQRVDFTGVLKGDALAQAYANMDVFVFPSLTDTYGNVVVEALASGVPAVVTDEGGPQFLVRSGKTGYVARNLAEFTSCIRQMSQRPEQLSAMRIAARNWAVGASWDRVFESVYASYEHGLNRGGVGSKIGVHPRVRAATPLG
ncbi:MAG TPA: glycosyltransferase [Terriglobales bacterium]|nr:glycosyltransferase [Terriglobales bacterium]